jgi:hypothetical protein
MPEISRLVTLADSSGRDRAVGFASLTTGSGGGETGSLTGAQLEIRMSHGTAAK